MGDLFSGLEKFGLEKLKDLDIYEQETKTVEKTEKQTQKKIAEIDFLFDKTYTCPVCDHEFKSKTVKTGKAKLLYVDSDLRPRYQGIDCIKYDVIVCQKCGYAALNRCFNHMTNPQARLVKQNITSSFQPLKESGNTYTYDEAIIRYKLALVNTVVTKGKNGERAYTCLKLAWLYRGKRESLSSEMKDYEKIKLGLLRIEYDFLKKAYEGFNAAFMKENFPICGMDEHTLNYVSAELARRLGKNEECLKLVSRILVSRDANQRIKNRARAIKEQIKKM